MDVERQNHRDTCPKAQVLASEQDTSIRLRCLLQWAPGWNVHEYNVDTHERKSMHQGLQNGHQVGCDVPNSASLKRSKRVRISTLGLLGTRGAASFSSQMIFVEAGSSCLLSVGSGQGDSSSEGSVASARFSAGMRILRRRKALTTDAIKAVYEAPNKMGRQASSNPTAT